MPVKTEIKVEGPTEEELQAVIAEARERARRRRLGIAGGLLAAAVLIVGIIFALNGVSGANDPAPQEGAATAPVQGGPEYLYIQRITFPRYGNGLLRVDPQTGDTRIVPWGEGCDKVKDCLVSVGEHLVIASPEVAQARQEGAGSTDSNDDGPAPLIALPSADRQSYWFGVHSHNQPYFGAGHLSGMREIGADGDVLRTVPVPQAFDRNSPDAAPEGGFVFRRPDTLKFWSLADERFTDLSIPGTGVADARGPLVASCSNPCSRLAITNVQNGEVAHADPPSGLEFRSYGASFSPDLGQIAIAVTRPQPSNVLPGAATSLTLVDTKTGKTTRIPQSFSDSSISPVMTWSRDGDQLYFLGRGYRLRQYTPGSGTKEITDLRVRRRVGLVQMADGPG